MSKWGDGNFDSDYACDYLTGIIYKLLESIQKCLTELPTNDICSDAMLMPAVDILFTLGKTYPHAVIHTLVDEPIDEWRNQCLSYFDKVSDGEQHTARRAIIVETFDNLQKLIEDES
jgi:hypothetical protein